MSSCLFTLKFYFLFLYTNNSISTVTRLASVMVLHPSRLRNSNVRPWQTTVLSETLTHPLRFTFTRPTLLLWSKERTPESVTPFNQHSSTSWSWWQNFPKKERLASPKPGQQRTNKDRKELLQLVDSRCDSELKSWMPRQFTKEKAFFNFEPQFMRKPKEPKWLILWHSSSFKLSSNTADFAKATSPLPETSKHLFRETCFRSGQPLPTAYSPTSVMPLHDITERDFSFFIPLAFPMTQKPFSFTPWRP